MDRLERSVVERLMYSLRSEPWDWHISGYWAKHKSGTAIWISNEVYGLRIHTSTDVDSPSYKPGWLIRRRLYRAVRFVGKAHVLNALSSALGITPNTDPARREP